MVVAYAKGTFLAWRMVAWLAIIYTIVPVIFIHIFVPESPVWLVAKGSIEEAARSLQYMYKNYPQPEHTVCNIDIVWLLDMTESVMNIDETCFSSTFPDPITGRYASE